MNRLDDSLGRLILTVILRLRLLLAVGQLIVDTQELLHGPVVQLVSQRRMHRMLARRLMNKVIFGAGVCSLH